MTRRCALFICALLPAGLLLMPACGSSHGGRMEISGEVKLEGEPIKDGAITFVPLDNQDTQSGAPITNGSYKIPAASGLKPGKYLVQITSGDGKTPTDEEAGGPGGSNIVSVDLVPPDWNVNSKQQVEVQSKGPNKFDFAIPKKTVIRKRK